MSQGLLKALIEKKLTVKKAPNVQGTVRLHFPNPEIQDFILTSFQPVDVFARIGMTADDVKKSNIAALLTAGHIVKVTPKK
jgi:hypothetical protein